MQLQRVSKKEPCAACGRTSWCMFSETSALCMRAQSEHQFIFKNGDVGWWHDSGVPRKQFKPSTKSEVLTIDAAALMATWGENTRDSWIDKMCQSIGVGFMSACQMGAAWSPEHQAWAWPMKDGDGLICGIRLRYEDGRKLAVKGSKQGLFIPKTEACNRVFMAEGPTDTAALLSLGIYAIGRPSASGGLLAIKQTIARLRIREVVIIADNDEDKEHNGRKFNPGYDGAKALQNHLQVPSCIIALPCKDSREFIKDGGTRDMLEYIAAQAIWHNPND